MFDPKTRTFTATGTMAVGRLYPATALLPDGRVLVAGGNGSAVAEQPLASAEIFDPKTGTWSTTGSMAAARDGLVAASLRDGRVLIAGGARDNSAELFDPKAGTFGPTGPTTVYRAGQIVTVVLVDGRVFLVGGSGGQDVFAAEIYQP